MRHIVNAIAAQGRHGDTELVHMNKGEVAALHGLAALDGRKLTKNPHTGLTEAWNLWPTVGGIVGGAIGTVIAPGAGTAAGAALGSGLATAASGGSTEQALTNGLISGVTAYAGAGIAQGLADTGAQAGTQLATDATTQSTAQLAPQAAESLAFTGPSVGSTAPSITGPELATVTPGAGGDVVNGVQTGANPLGASANPTPMTPPKMGEPGFMDNVVKGFQNTSGMDLVKKYGVNAATAGIGAYGLMSDLTAPNSGITTPVTNTANPYKGEIYYTPDGIRRARVVKAAAGGEIYGGYDDVEAAADGGYMPGGGENYAKGGLSSLPQAQTQNPSRFLQGPGDGLSDSIPANIDGKQPARLATGEFVVSADAVSALGNGDSTAGAQRLYGMMDRIRQQAHGTKQQMKKVNPNKVLPA